jgi:hypothetical protein
MQNTNHHGRRRKTRARAGVKTTAAASAVGIEPLAVAPNVAFRLIGVGITKGYELIGSGELRSFRIGRARRITMDSIRALIAKKLAEARSSSLEA